MNSDILNKPIDITLQQMVVELLARLNCTHAELARSVNLGQATVTRIAGGNEAKYLTGKKIEALYRREICKDLRVSLIA